MTEPKPQTYYVTETKADHERMSAAAATAQYPCATCGAAVGTRCTRKRGARTLRGAHPERILALLNAEKAKR